MRPNQQQAHIEVEKRTTTREFVYVNDKIVIQFTYFLLNNTQFIYILKRQHGATLPLNKRTQKKHEKLIKIIMKKFNYFYFQVFFSRFFLYYDVNPIFVCR